MRMTILPVLQGLMIGWIALLLGCSNGSTIPPTSGIVDRLHLTPDTLLQHPCENIPPGETVRSLAVGYANNTSCVNQYYLLIERQKEYKQRIERLYETGGSATSTEGNGDG